MHSLSVILITKNEAHNIRGCLESVAWADEIIVVDSGSIDGTAEIARAMGASVHVYGDWPGFGPQKNRALDHATQEWVLSIDADERVTPELRAEIAAALDDPQADGYSLPRLSSFCGRYIRHSGWQPDHVLRLFRRGQGRFTDDLVHERLVVDGRVVQMNHWLLHESFRDLEQVLAKMNHYSSAGAEMLNRKGREASLAQAVLHGLWAFIRAYFLRTGFLDGREGFMLAVATAEGSYYRYAKRLLMKGDRGGD